MGFPHSFRNDVSCDSEKETDAALVPISLNDALDGFCSGTVSVMSRALVRISRVYWCRSLVEEDAGTSSHATGFRYERAS